jgi:hypothetical protein
MLTTEVAVLRARLEAAEKLDAIRVETIEDQRKRLDRAELLLTDQRGQPNATQEPVAGRSWWSRLLGRQ